MPVDTSFYPTAQPQPFNPLTTIQGYAGAAHAMGENQLLQQQIRGRAALGKAVQASTNPSTGQVDTNKLTSLVSQDPDASWMALQVQGESENNNRLTTYQGKNAQGIPTQMQAPLPQVMGMGNPAQQAQGQQSAPSQDTIDGWHKHLGTVAEILDTVDNPDVQQKDLIRATADAVGHPDAQVNSTDGAVLLSGLPHGPNGTPAPSQQLQGFVQNKKQQVQQLQQHLNANYPSSDQLAAQHHPPLQLDINPPQDHSTPGSPVANPTGYESNLHPLQQHYNDVRNDANSVGQQNAILGNILGLSKAGAPTGTMVGKTYQYLAEHNLATPGITKSAEQLQEITKYMAQAAISAGMPGSDSRLEALQDANTHPEQLPGTIQSLIPFLEAVNNGKVARAKYYEATDPTGSDPNKIQQAQMTWNQHFDPLLLELQQLQKSDPAAFKKMLSQMDPAEARELHEKWKNMNQFKLLGQ